MVDSTLLDPRHTNPMNKPPKILVIDDTPIDVLLLSRLLRQEGYDVSSAESGAVGYNMAVSQQPDLILLDIMMPGQDGYGVCRLLKENKLTVDIPVIFVTARSETIDKVTGLNAGGVDYVIKPFQATEALARIRTHLRLKAMHEDNLEYQKALLQSQKMASITTLAGGVAHNINNLMGAVIGYADILQGSLDHDEKAHYYTDRILEASQRAADLARDLLTYATAGRGIISSINIQELLEKMVTLYGNGDLSKVHVDLRIAQNIPEIQADDEQILQVLSNIFMNSREATPEGGTITISANTGQLPPHFHCDGSESTTDTYVIIAISDTGSGMDEETAERIFEPSFTTKQTVGVGLGLSAACGIIQKHKGGISVETEPGEGSTFYVYLPIV